MTPFTPWMDSRLWAGAPKSARCSPKLWSMVAATLLLMWSAADSVAQLPATRLGAVFPAGSQAGQQVDVTVFGVDLDDVDRLLFSHAGITAKQKLADLGPFDKTPQPLANQFTVSVAANVPVGVYEVRAAGKYGVSNPRAFRVGDVPELLEVEPNNSKKNATEVKLPAVINGQSNQAGDLDFFQFEAPAGQRLIVTSCARRADSPMDSIVTVYDPVGRVVASSGDDHRGDSLVDFTTSTAGRYGIKIHDSTYLGSGEHVYRLTVGALPHIDFVFPPAGEPGGSRDFIVYGTNLPGGQPSSLRLGNRVLQQANVKLAVPAGLTTQGFVFHSSLSPATAGLDTFEYRVKGPQGTSDPVLVGVAGAPAVREAANDDPAKAQVVNIPCEVMGQFFPLRDRDWYEFEAKKDERIAVEVISQRMELPTNASLLVQQVKQAAEGDVPEQVQQLAYVYESTDASGGAEFDVRHQDPSFQFTASADGIYRIMVRDAFADVAADPRRTYRLCIAKGPGDFRLAAIPEQSFSSALLRKGGQVGIRVVAFRRGGFDGAITVTATGLPAGVTCSNAVIGPSSNMGMLVLNAAANAAPATAFVKVTGTAAIGGKPAVREARFGAALRPTAVRQNPNQALNAVDARVTRNLAVSVSASENAMVAFQAGGGKVWETARGGKLAIPVTRGGAFKGQINFIGRGLPGVTFPQASLAANKPTGEVQVSLTANVPPGTHSFFLDGIAQQVDYARNPEAAAAAAERKKEVDAIKVKADADAKVAVAAKAVADKAAADTTAKVTEATMAKAAADKAVVDGVAAEKAATVTAQNAATAAKAKPDDTALKTTAAMAKSAADGAVAKVRTATAAAETAAKALADAMVKAKTAGDAKVKADAEAAKATMLAQAAAQLKTQADQQATNLANAAKPKKLNVPVVSTPITLKVAPAPVTVPAIQPIVVKQGQKAEGSVSIARLFNYEGAVTFAATTPPGVVGLSIPNVSVPAKQTAAKFAVTANANATVGEHTVRVRATMNFNGQNLTVDHVLRLTVQMGEPVKS